MSNDVDTLRGHLFDAMKELKAGTLSIEKAKAMSEIAQTIINSAKVEVEYAKATGKSGSKFLEKQAELPAGITGTTVHKIR
jgi:hypothetical protein